MSFIIGGSSSTGSSLLRNILNRHPDIFCGPESYMFTYPIFYQDWERSKPYLLGNKEIKCPFWMKKKGVSLVNSEYIWRNDQLPDLVRSSRSLAEFSSSFFDLGVKSFDKSIWGEKTPANAYCFDYFLKIGMYHNVIHLYRNPYDTIASMVERGFPVLYAVGIYLFNTSFALKSRSSVHYYELSYEALVKQAENEIFDLCHFLGVTPERDILEAGYEQRDDSIKHLGWMQSETHAIGTRSLGRFKSLSVESQRKIIAICHQIRITASYLKEHELVQDNIMHICDLLGYDYLVPKTSERMKRMDIKKLFMEDRISRLKLRLPAMILRYPLEIDDER